MYADKRGNCNGPEGRKAATDQTQIKANNFLLSVFHRCSIRGLFCSFRVHPRFLPVFSNPQSLIPNPSFPP